MGESLDPFGPTLRRLRVRAGLTQEQLAERAGLSSRAVRALESGGRKRPYPHTVSALGEALGLGDEARTALSAARPPATRPLPELAIPRTRLIGRDADVRAISEQLLGGRARLITLIGPGGVGKSRLAIEVAHQLEPEMKDGVAVSLLGRLQDPGLVLPTIAQSLELQDRGNRPLLETLQAYLRDRQLLIVLDNFEHVLDAASDVAPLLEAAPRLRVLVTSRSPLQLRAEHLRPVPPLAAQPASALLAERITQAGGEEDIDPAVAHAICQRLDRLPLAIELAAARTRVLPAASLLRHLDQGLDLLVTGFRDLPSRQRTLRATIGWSYDLLSPDEQALLCHVAIFAGGWTLAAAAAVAELDEDVALELHTGLIDASLIERQAGHGEPRFGVLETVRAFALEKLEAGHGSVAARERHAAWCHEMAVEARSGLERTDELSWLNRLTTEQDNLRVAMRWLLDQDDLERMSDICFSVQKLWVIRGLFTEAERWASEALARTPAADLLVRARLGGLVTTLRITQGRQEESHRAAIEVVELARQVDDPFVLAWALLGFGLSAVTSGRAEEGRAALEEAEQLCGQLGLIGRLVTARLYLANIAWAAGRMAEADRRLAAIMPDAGGPALWAHASVLNARSRVALGDGDHGRAREFAARAITILDRFQDSWIMAHSVTCLACAAVLGGHPESAAQLFGASDLLFERVSGSLLPFYTDVDAHGRAATIAELGDARFEKLARRSVGLTAADLIALGAGCG